MEEINLKRKRLDEEDIDLKVEKFVNSLKKIKYEYDAYGLRIIPNDTKNNINEFEKYLERELTGAAENNDLNKLYRLLDSSFFSGGDTGTQYLFGNVYKNVLDKVGIPLLKTYGKWGNYIAVIKLLESINIHTLDDILFQKIINWSYEQRDASTLYKMLILLPRNKMSPIIKEFITNACKRFDLGAMKFLFEEMVPLVHMIDVDEELLLRELLASKCAQQSVEIRLFLKEILSQVRENIIISNWLGGSTNDEHLMMWMASDDIKKRFRSGINDDEIYTLYRGIGLDKSDHRMKNWDFKIDYEVGTIFRMKIDQLSSWSLSDQVAKKFGSHMVLRTKVPGKDIFANFSQKMVAGEGELEMVLNPGTYEVEICKKRRSNGSKAITPFVCNYGVNRLGPRKR